MNLKTLLIATAISAATFVAAAADPGVRPDPSAQAKKHTRRGELAHEIVSKWGALVQETYRTNVGSWAKEMGPLFQSLPVDTLQRAANAQTFTAMNDVLLGKGDAAVRSTPTANLIGDEKSDLTYVPVQPCRIFDTRVSGAGGPIAANTVRDFDVTAVSNYSFQGGSSSDCNGVGAAGSFAAAVINFTTVNPAGVGYITAFPFGTTQPLAATVNYNGSDIKGNNAIVALDTGASANELSIYSVKTVNVVGDIVGYFIRPQATALQCTEVESAPVTFAAGDVNNVFSPACPASYTKVEVQCRPSSFGMSQAGSWTDHCNFRNTGSSSATATAAARCCRVPGR